MNRLVRKYRYLFLGCAGAAALRMLVWGAWPQAAWARGKKFDLVNGQKLFERVWQPTHDAESGSDGLGPLFNERSCIACHNQGGHRRRRAQQKQRRAADVHCAPRSC